MVGACFDPRPQGRGEVPGLRPRGIEAAVGDAVHARRQRFALRRMVAQVPAAAGIGQHQVERGVGFGPCQQSGGGFGGVQRPGEERRRQRAARGPRIRLGEAVAHIGDHRDPAAGIEPDPGTAGLQVAAGDHPGSGPAGKGGGRTGVEFVAVAGQHQPPTGVEVAGEGDDAHAPFWRVRDATCIHVLRRNMPRTRRWHPP